MFAPVSAYLVAICGAIFAALSGLSLIYAINHLDSQSQ